MTQPCKDNLQSITALAPLREKSSYHVRRKEVIEAGFEGGYKVRRPADRGRQQKLSDRSKNGAVSGQNGSVIGKNGTVFGKYGSVFGYFCAV